MTRKKALTTDDIQQIEDSTPSDQLALEKRVERLEKQLDEAMATKASLTDDQATYIAAYRAALQGLGSAIPGYTRKPHALYEFLKEARRVALTAVEVANGANVNAVADAIKRDQ